MPASVRAAARHAAGSGESCRGLRKPLPAPVLETHARAPVGGPVPEILVLARASKALARSFEFCEQLRALSFIPIEDVLCKPDAFAGAALS